MVHMHPSQTHIHREAVAETVDTPRGSPPAVRTPNVLSMSQRHFNTCPPSPTIATEHPPILRCVLSMYCHVLARVLMWERFYFIQPRSITRVPLNAPEIFYGLRRELWESIYEVLYSIRSSVCSVCMGWLYGECIRRGNGKLKVYHVRVLPIFMYKARVEWKFYNP